MTVNGSGTDVAPAPAVTLPSPSIVVENVPKDVLLKPVLTKK